MTGRNGGPFGSELSRTHRLHSDRFSLTGSMGPRIVLRDVPLNVIAVVGDELVGQVSATIKDPASTIELIAMWVSPAARRTGVADTLIGAVITWAAAQHASTVELSVKAANTAARRLYERNGFFIAGLGGTGDEDEVRMIRALS